MDYTDDYGFVRPYLVNDEYILWKGKPEKGNIFSLRQIIPSLFGLVWLSFSVFWVYTALKSSGAFPFALFGIPFVCIGLYLTFGQFLQAIFLRSKTFYVITNKKIIVKKGKRMTMHDAKQLPPMDVEIHKNGNGTVFFSEDVYTRRGNSHRIYLVLENIKDIAQVQNAISQMMEN